MMSKKAKTINSKYPTEKTTGDAIHTIAKAGIGAIPLVGAPASELLSCLVTPPLEKRRSEFLEDVGKRLKDLEDQGVISLEELPENEKFIDITMLAIQAALRTSVKEKRDALRNAIIKSAKPGSQELAVQQMFINYIDSFTVWHIKILDLVNNPKGWAEKNNHKFKDIQGTKIFDILEDAFPELRDGRDFCQQVWNDLQSRGLLTNHSFQSGATEETIHNYISSTGEAFLIYIAEEAKKEQQNEN